MLLQHPDPTLGPVISDDSPLWRYVDLAKLIDLLSSDTLYFAASEQLTAGDPWEGKIHPDDVRRFVERSEQAAAARGQESALNASLVAALANQSTATYINCWQESTPESVAMWKMYAEHGVALRTSMGRMKCALLADHDIHIGKVEYGESGLGKSSSDWVRRNLQKRSAFKSEQEVRLLVSGAELEPDRVAAILPGLRVPVNLNCLLAEIVISPFASAYEVDAIKSVVSKFAPGIPCSQSTLLDPPRYI